MDKVEVNRTEIFKYFEDLISDKETWEGDETQRKTTATMIHGALVFANIFDLITNDEQMELINCDGCFIQELTDKANEFWNPFEME